MSPSISVAGSPSAMPNGIITVSVAAWLFTKADTQNIAMAKVQGATCTMDLMLAMRNGLLDVTKVSLIQAMPKIDTTAIMPAVKTCDLAMSGMNQDEPPPCPRHLRRAGACPPPSTPALALRRSEALDVLPGLRRLRALRGLLDDPVPGGDRLRLILEVVGVDDAQVVDALHVAGVDLVRALEVRDRLVEGLELAEHDALVGEDVGVVGLQRERLGVGVHGALGLVRVEIVVPERDPRLDVLRVLRRQPLLGGDALLHGAGLRHQRAGRHRARRRQQ